MRTYLAGQILFWEGGSLWIGRSNGTTSTHVHHAIQIGVALDGTFRLKTPEDPDWRAYTGAIIPSHQPHTYSTVESVVALIFVEPESHEGQILLQRYGGGGVATIPEAVTQDAAALLGPAYFEERGEEKLVGAAHEVIRLLTAGARPRVVVDDRILQAISLVKERIAGPVLQDEIAEAVFLSPSRFRHLFVEETGMAFRPYVLWLRLHRALECLTAGESLTNAAHASGFSDLAHFSRTFRRMFGIAPTMLEQPDSYAPTVSRSE
ncbi:MAG TPA: AraC family transcriptional regulator [Rhodothermales bacterium]|nr:AraC family transcriptional regulator [Rhodothermales bacterium]